MTFCRLILTRIAKASNGTQCQMKNGRNDLLIVIIPKVSKSVESSKCQNLVIPFRSLGTDLGTEGGDVSQQYLKYFLMRRTAFASLMLMYILKNGKDPSRKLWIPIP